MNNPGEAPLFLQQQESNQCHRKREEARRPRTSQGTLVSPGFAPLAPSLHDQPGHDRRDDEAETGDRAPLDDAPGRINRDRRLPASPSRDADSGDNRMRSRAPADGPLRRRYLDSSSSSPTICRKLPQRREQHFEDGFDGWLRFTPSTRTIARRREQPRLTRVPHSPSAPARRYAMPPPPRARPGRQSPAA